MAKCSSEQRESPWSIAGCCGPGFCPALRHGWPMAKCSSEQRESPWGIEGYCGPGFCPALRHGWPMAKWFLRAARKPLESSRGAAGRAFALRFVTVGRWPNVPQSSAKALGVIEERYGLGFCPALRHGWPMAKCSSERRESPWGHRRALWAGLLPCASLRRRLLEKSSRSCKTLLYYTGYYRQNKALNCELFCSGYGAAPKNMTKDTTPLCFVL